MRDRHRFDTPWASLDGMTRSRRRLVALGVLVAASVFAVGLDALRLSLSANEHYAWLAWNLFLAWIPLCVALFAYDRHRRGARTAALVAPLLVWLAFLPNAPYIVTDFVHLRRPTDIPLWFDITVLTSFAWTGVMLGFVSVYLVQAIVRDRFGSVAGWATVVAAFGLSGIGVYLGRVLRLNSWDLVVRPNGVLGDLAAQLDSARFLGMSLFMATLLTLGYAMLYTVTHAVADDLP